MPVIDVDVIDLSVSKPKHGDSVMAELDPNGYLHWKEKLYSTSQDADRDARFFHDALKSGHLEGKMSAREMTFARNVPPVAADHST